jgi:uroporphyrinogen decarboxylase
MTHRERVLAAMARTPPDRVPIDFGGTVDSTIAAVAYPALRNKLGLPPGTTRIADVLSQAALVDDDVREALDVDTMLIAPEPSEWRAGALPDGSPCELPDGFRPRLLEDGSHAVFDEEGNVIARMPKDGYYFDPTFVPLANATSPQDVEKSWKHIAGYDMPCYPAESYEQLATRAKALRETSDCALVGYFGGHIFQAGQALRGWDTFLVDLVSDPPLAHAILSALLDANLARFEVFAATVGQHLDVIHFEEDLGMQHRPLVSPATFRKMLKPYLKRLFDFARSKCSARLLLHSDGAIAPFISDLIEIGVDALNPIQVSAAGMDPGRLKREFGRDICFWGAGCDSQSTLPFGTPAEVSAEARQRIDELAEGGGFVFASIHNVQPEVTADNVIAMFRTARTYGSYREV